MNRYLFLVLMLIITAVLFSQTAVMPDLGDGTRENPYQIATWQNLYWISTLDTVNGLTQADRWSKHYIQTANINFENIEPSIQLWNNNTGWTPIGFEYSGASDQSCFSGSYDGNNKFIKGLYIYKPSGYYVGLFGFVAGEDTEIKNLRLINASVDSNTPYCGGLVAHNGGKITNCSIQGSVNGYTNDYIGGLVGSNSGLITNCYSSAGIAGFNYSGGMVGFNSGTINNSYSTGSYHLGAQYCTGGLVGVNTGTITNCHNSGYIAGGVKATGGLVGDNRGTIDSCYTSGDFVGHNQTGGLVGINSGFISNSFSHRNINVYDPGNNDVGGLVGLNLGIICNSYSTGVVNNPNYNTGGLIGTNWIGIVLNCYSTGNVSGYNTSGGLIGLNNCGKISNCYSTGYVNGSDIKAGGLVGDNWDGTVNGSFWDMQTSGQSSSSAGTGKTTAEMKTQSTYTDAGWDFVNNWSINPSVNDGYPMLLSTAVSNDEQAIDEIKPLLSVYPAYPNPFNPSTTISFNLSSHNQVDVSVYNIKGQKVRTLLSDKLNSGKHQVVWNGKDNDNNNCASGVYFYRVKAGNLVKTNKIMMLK